MMRPDRKVISGATTKPSSSAGPTPLQELTGIALELGRLRFERDQAIAERDELAARIGPLEDAVRRLAPERDEGATDDAGDTKPEESTP